MIEKAYKKLRLDALVIQQGRLTENNASKVRRWRAGEGAAEMCMYVRERGMGAGGTEVDKVAWQRWHS